MKVLFVGNTRRTALALHYFTNLVKLGYLVLPYDPEYFYARHLFEKISTRLTKSPSPARIRSVADTLTNLCRKNRFDVVMVMAENFISADLLETMRKVSKTAPTMVYHSHDNNFSSGILKPSDFAKTIQAYDFVFTTKSQNVARYQAWGQENAYYIASAYEPSIHHPISDEYSLYAGKLFDVTFIGTYDKSRIKYLDAVGWDQLKVWGDRWTRFPKYRRHRGQINSKAVYDFEFADITSHSKIALGLLREEAEDLHTTRTFEIPACGTLQIAPRNDEILKYFDEDVDFVAFASPEELADKVNYYLRNEVKRRQIARSGHERCLRDKHTYLDRVLEIFQKIDGARKPSPSYFVKNSATLAK